MEIPYLLINGTRFEIDGINISYQFADLSTDYTGRSEVTGKMVKDIIKQIYSIEIDFGEMILDETTVSSFFNATKSNGVIFPITLPIIGKIGMSTLNVYTGDFSGSYEKWETGVNFYTDVKVSFIQE